MCLVIWFLNAGRTGDRYLFDGTVGKIYSQGAEVHPGPDWSCNGVGDFDGDGNVDIVLEDVTGQKAIWLLDANQSITVGQVFDATAGPNWKISATGDFNGDSHDDL